MSDTDKTKPFKIKILQNPEWRKEIHNHEHGTCDFYDNDIPNVLWTYGNRRSYCGYWTSRKGAQHIWARNSNAEQSYREEANGRARRQIRHLKREIMKMTREDIEDCEFLSMPHRHQALWDLDLRS